MDGWTGQGCEKESPGLSIEIRRDGVYGYRFTSGLRVGAGPAVLDPQKKVLYVAAYDAATGRDAVLEVDPLNPSGHLVGSEASLTRGWGSLEGPRITSTTMVPKHSTAARQVPSLRLPQTPLRHRRAPRSSTREPRATLMRVHLEVGIPCIVVLRWIYPGHSRGCTLHTTCITRLR